MKSKPGLDEILGVPLRMKLNPPVLNLPKGRFHRAAISSTKEDLFRVRADLVEKDSGLYTILSLFLVRKMSSVKKTVENRF